MPFPELSLDLMPDKLKEPVRLWSERESSNGCLLFYCEYDFQAITRPLLMRQKFHQMAELAFPPTDNASRFTLQVFQKRRFSIWVQQKGIPIWVDLDVPHFQNINLLGVPKGWRSYITRAKGYPELLKEFRTACDHCGDAELVKFVVYGGDTKTLQICKDFGWQWVPPRR